jgi:hypothetical protein
MVRVGVLATILACWSFSVSGEASGSPQGFSRFRGVWVLGGCGITLPESGERGSCPAAIRVETAFTEGQWGLALLSFDLRDREVLGPAFHRLPLTSLRTPSQASRISRLRSGFRMTTEEQILQHETPSDCPGSISEQLWYRRTLNGRLAQQCVFIRE